MYEEDNIINSAQMKSILSIANRNLNDRIKRKTKLPTSAGSKWTNEEDEQLKEEYISKMSINEIAKIHQRSTGGINSRIVKLFPECKVYNKNVGNLHFYIDFCTELSNKIIMRFSGFIV